MFREHVGLRMPVEILNFIDRVAFHRRIHRAPGRSATRSAVIIDFIRRGIEQERASEGSISRDKN